MLPEILHPVRGDSLTALERELWRFRMVAVEAQVMLRGFYGVPGGARELSTDLLFCLTNHALIIVSKFLEIWDDFGSLVPTHKRVLEVRQAVDPLLKRIAIWKGFTTFRNTVLAHPYLTKDGTLVGPWHLMHTQQAPTYHAETILLLKCTMFASAGVLAAFYDEYKALGPSLRSELPEPDWRPGIRNGTDIDAALRPLLQSIDQRLQSLGVPPANPVFAEFRRALQVTND